MMKRLLLYLLAGAILLAVAITADRGYKDTALLQQYAAEISAYLAGQESEAQAWVLQQQPALRARAAGQPVAHPADWINTLTGQAAKPYTVLIHAGDSILFASNNKALPQREQLAEIDKAGERAVLQLSLGYYYARRQNFGPAQTLTLLVPIRFTLGAARQEQSGGLFPANPSISRQVGLRLKPTGHPIQINGADLCWLQANGAVQAAWVQWLKLLAYGLLLGLMLAVAFKFALQWAKKGWALPGAAFLLTIVGSLFWLNRSTGFTAHTFDQLPFFAQRFDTYSLIGNSLGDWLLHLVLLLWLMVYFHRAFRTDNLTHLPPMPVRLTLSVVCYLLVMLSVLVGIGVCRQLVFHSAITFDFDNLLNFNSFSVLAFAGIFLLLLALFLFAHRLIMTTRQLELPGAYRAAGIVGSALALYFIGLGYPGGLQLSAWYIAGFALVYVAAFDFFLEMKTPGLGGLVLWLMLFSLSSALLLYRYNYLKDQGIRESYVQALATERDTFAEPQLAAVLAQVRSDTQINRLLKPWPFKPQTAELRRRLNALVYPHSYLFQHYRLTVFAFDKDGLILPQDQAQGRRFVVDQNWSQAAPLPGAPDIRYLTGADGIFRYLMRIPALRMGDPTQPAELYCFFEHHYPQPTRVYSELFYPLPYKNLTRLSEYDFAVQHDGRLIVDQGQVNQVVFQQSLPGGAVQEQLSEAPRRVDAVYKTANGQTIAAVGRSLGGWYKQLYLFSVLFALTTLFIFTLALLNTYVHFLPAYYQFNFSTKGSLAKRIHYGNFALIGLAFIGIGLLTYQHFARAAQDAERANLDNRADALLTHLRSQMAELSPASDTLKRALPATVAPLAASLSTDVNLFSPEGDLLFSSQNDLAQLGILPSRMSPQAWAMLTEGENREAVVAEQVADAEFSNRYLPLLNGQNQLLGYLGVPYYLSDRKIGPEVSDFIGMLASAYVFLLLIAYSVSFLLSQSIIRPVQLISSKIRQLQLEDNNQPLVYQGDAQDELSALIEEYNRMVEKLEESKSQLIRLERESAWREMARQVAHDIKNPLTTMKLSMQQLERVSSEPAQAAAYLKKAITRLIEQIDSLAQIASEFSMFANLDIQQKHDLVLNDVVESVYDLFSEQKDVHLNLQIPADRFHISGDKNHLIRVFNNLIINAIQAIPSDRRGEIRVSLYRRDQHAIVQITDNGGGIPPEIQKRVFEPNFTTKTSGSGLGLAICRKIVEALDGAIRFETRENEGTDFFVELPITAMETANQPDKARAH
ncbi:MAG: HAMP domain-containing histidine kinase [Saprospirales bacterium]|nr:HAMP domain-containing histidine kinase [Saprospirales bacterium]MBK8922168.1 HAMP domain-containing histidine kinase [Saprospirales bacterium]